MSADMVFAALLVLLAVVMGPVVLLGIVGWVLNEWSEYQWRKRRAAARSTPQRKSTR